MVLIAGASRLPSRDIRILQMRISSQKNADVFPIRSGLTFSAAAPARRSSTRINDPVIPENHEITPDFTRYPATWSFVVAGSMVDYATKASYDYFPFRWIHPRQDSLCGQLGVFSR